MKALKLCRIVSKILTGAECEIQVNELFSYQIEDDCILIPKKVDFSEKMEQAFIKMCRDIGLGELNPYLASFIHELGHQATVPFFSEAEMTEYLAQVQLLESLLQTDLLNESDTNEFYHTLEVESAANEWARDAFIAHRHSLLKINKKFNRIYRWK